MSSKSSKAFLALVRLGVGHSTFQTLGDVDWSTTKALADKHGLSAVVLDGLNSLPHNNMSQMMRLKWIGEVLQSYEHRYSLYEKAIGSLAGWYHQHGYKMMVLKGYACSLNWPKPNHRPCGDIDIWLFGQQREADAALGSWFLDEPSDKVERKVLAESSDQGRAHDPNFKIDKGHHHHTVFEWEGFTVENHYDFLNVHHHKSNVEMEAILKNLGQDDSHYVDVQGQKVYFPSPNLHALFLLRHSMSNFASTGFQLRQLLDWAFFVEKQGNNINWDWLEAQLEHFGMKKLYDVFNTICVEDLGFDIKLFPQGTFQPDLKDRVLNDILSPEFSEKETGGFLSRAFFKYRRWKANAWKHELCFSESLWSAFWSGVWGHLIKPGMI